MFNYVLQKYGSDHVALVSTITIRKARSALKDVARIMNIDLDMAMEVAKLVPQVWYGEGGEKQTDLKLSKAISVVPELAEYAAQYPAWFEMAQQLEGIPSYVSTHAAGILITSDRLSEYLPVLRPDHRGLSIAALTLSDAEAAGVVKFDFLSLDSLSVYEQTQQDIKCRFDTLSSQYDDKEVWDAIGTNTTTGLFQISSFTYKKRMPRIKPQSIDELAACLALLRGPCISAGLDETYMKILEGKAKKVSVHPLFDKAVDKTNGVLIFQEQLMELATSFGLTLEDGYGLVKAAAKKDFDKLKKFEGLFRSHGKTLGVPEREMGRIWHTVLDSGQYLFNKSHATDYALLTYISAWLKAHHPLEFAKNLFDNAYGKSTDKRDQAVKEILKECSRLKIKFLPIDINLSHRGFSLEDGKLRPGLCSIKGFSDNAIEAVLEQRPYESFTDFVDRTPKKQCTKASIVPSIFAGVFDSFDKRMDVYNKFCALRKDVPQDKIKIGKEQYSLSNLRKVSNQILGGNFAA